MSNDQSFRQKSVMDKTFHEIEHEAWMSRARLYDSMFAAISTQAIDETLKSLGNLQGKRFLDVACGTGHLVAVASERGAISQGVDFAETMIEMARKNYPSGDFRVADATMLPFNDCSFDAATCMFGLSHMENPQVAVNEAFRVLRLGGFYAFALWFGADEGNEFLKIVQDALAAFVKTDVGLPSNWTQLRIANRERCEMVTHQAGFEKPRFRRILIIWPEISGRGVIDLLDTVSVRTKIIVERQPPAVQKQIREFIHAAMESRRAQGVRSLAWPALLTVVRKPM
jgi:ubiquinone/menaquinone biosynthesis C-methylase UbiE